MALPEIPNDPEVNALLLEMRELLRQTRADLRATRADLTEIRETLERYRPLLDAAEARMSGPRFFGRGTPRVT